MGFGTAHQKDFFKFLRTGGGEAWKAVGGSGFFATRNSEGVAETYTDD